jgi:phosphatidylglycerol---prolipoprotein diacylglyceryl transferase
MHPILISFRFPIFLSHITWIEWVLTALVVFLFFLRSRKNQDFRLQSFGFGVGMYALLRGLVYFAGPGYEFQLHTYGVLIALGFVVGIVLAVRQAKKEGVSPNVILDLSFWILIAAMVGSRILYIIVNANDYIADPLSLIKIWQGGLVFYGGFIGAVLTSWWYMRKHAVPFLKVADIFIPSVSLGHVFGRLGCFAAGCCHGMPAGSSAFGVVFTDPGTVVSRNHLLGVPLHPTQLYEATGELLIFLTLLFFRRRKRFHGQLLVTYLILYPILRSIVEIFRGDYERGMLFRIDLFGSSSPELLSTSQLISLLLAIGGIVLLVLMRRKRLHPEVSETQKKASDF